MKSFRILHFSDLHRPDKETPEYRIGQVKQEDLKPDFNFLVTDHWVDNFFRVVKGWEKSNSKIDIIAFSGDLGDKGNISSINEGVSLIENACNRLNISKDSVILCPGNHDLDQKKGLKAFDGFNKSLKDAGFNNICIDDNICCLKIGDIPIYAINSCLGATQESLFIEKYKMLISKLKAADFTRFAKEAEDLKQDYMKDYLDIPAITVKQAEELASLVSECEADTAIVLLHHNLFPNKSVDCRPYCNVIDGGATLNMLNNSERNIFLLHGHIHFNDSILTYSPKNGKNFISSLGTGCLNGKEGSTASIIEFFFTDDNKHIITNVYQIIYNGGFERLRKYSIHNKLTTNQSKINYSQHLEENSWGLSFAEISEKTLDPNKNDLIKVLLSDQSIQIQRNSSMNYQDWKFSKQI
jgi:hypothetical protein